MKLSWQQALIVLACLGVVCAAHRWGDPTLQQAAAMASTMIALLLRSPMEPPGPPSPPALPVLALFLMLGGCAHLALTPADDAEIAVHAARDAACMMLARSRDAGSRVAAFDACLAGVRPSPPPAALAVSPPGNNPGMSAAGHFGGRDAGSDGDGSTTRVGDAS